MPANPPEDTPHISPYLLYEDCNAALEFLSKAFGFEERMRIPGPEGAVYHAEMTFGGGVIMMGWPGPDYQGPKTLGHVTQNQYVYVDDVDAHHAHAKAAGANVLDPPTDQFYGDRRYSVEDPQGHVWFFAQRVKEVSVEEMQAHTA